MVFNSGEWCYLSEVSSSPSTIPSTILTPAEKNARMTPSYKRQTDKSIPIQTITNLDNLAVRSSVKTASLTSSIIGDDIDDEDVVVTSNVSDSQDDVVTDQVEELTVTSDMRLTQDTTDSNVSLQTNVGGTHAPSIHSTSLLNTSSPQAHVITSSNSTMTTLNETEGSQKTHAPSTHSTFLLNISSPQAQVITSSSSTITAINETVGFRETSASFNSNIPSTSGNTFFQHGNVNSHSDP